LHLWPLASSNNFARSDQFFQGSHSFGDIAALLLLFAATARSIYGYAMNIFTLLNFEAFMWHRCGRLSWVPPFAPVSCRCVVG
jgi:hypothetical protein